MFTDTIFCSKFYKFEFANHDTVVNKLDLSFVDDNYINGLQKFSLSQKEVLNYYGYIIEKIIGSLNNLSYIEGPWLTVYSSGDKMESHSHRNFEYTMMHYISLDKTHPQTIIEDVNSGREYYPNCVEGDIIVIPGYLNHRVDMVNIDNKKRVVGVLNFNSINFVPIKQLNRSSSNTEVKNILEDYIYPGDDNLIFTPIPDGMCKNCSIE